MKSYSLKASKISPMPFGKSQVLKMDKNNYVGCSDSPLKNYKPKRTKYEGE